MTQHLLQSQLWENFQKHIGYDAVRVPKAGDCLLLLEKLHGRVGRLFTRAYAPYGPVGKSKQQLSEAIESLILWAEDNHVDVLRVEPVAGDGIGDVLSDRGFKKRLKSTQPEMTSVVYLDGTDDDVISRMNATNRNLYRKNIQQADKGVRFRDTYGPEDIKSFIEMMHETSRRTGAKFHSDKYFSDMINYFATKKAGGLLTASYEGEDVASAIYLVDVLGKTLYYLHAGSTSKARDCNAGNLLVSKLIMMAKEQGMTKVDLYGVAPLDSSADHPLYGISKFKRAYGGEDVIYCGTWEISISAKHKLLQKITRRHQR